MTVEYHITANQTHSTATTTGTQQQKLRTIMEHFTHRRRGGNRAHEIVVKMKRVRVERGGAPNYAPEKSERLIWFVAWF